MKIPRRSSHRLFAPLLALLGYLAGGAVSPGLSAHPVGETKSADDGVDRCIAWIQGRDSTQSADVLRVGERTLCLDTTSEGLTSTVTRSFIEAMDDIPAPAKPTIVVRSFGGRTDLGLDIGKVILERQATVHVSMFCVSSCANYVFLAAAERHILPGSVVLFHGGLVPALLSLMEEAQIAEGMATSDREQARRRTEADLQRQSELLSARGITADFFEWMEALNNGDPELERRCPGENLTLLAFSDSALSQRGVGVASNAGPRSARELHDTLAPFGLADGACYWE